jgi:hypothetical protein
MAPVRTALVQLDADYTQSRVVQALSVSSTQKFQVLTSLEPGQVPDLYWTEYEQIPWETLLTDHSTPISQRPVLCSYCIRKALIRKAQLSWIIQKWCAKYPDSILNTRIPLTRILEVDHPDYLDEALSDAFELRDILEKNEQLSDSSQWSWVLLKPSMTNKGSGIKLIGTVSQLKSFFEDLYETTMDSDIEDDHTSSSAVDSAGALSFVREWVLQQYIGRPLLLPRYDNRKFHLRVYALAVGDLSVYVFDQILALFSMKPYSMDDTEDTLVHLTNTCLQVEETGFKEEDAVRLFFDLLDRSGDEEKSKAQWGKVFEAIKQVSGEVFRAAASESTMFQPLPNAFELFGLDFVIDDGYQIYFLEANAYPGKHLLLTPSSNSRCVSRYLSLLLQAIMVCRFQTNRRSTG